MSRRLISLLLALVLAFGAVAMDAPAVSAKNERKASDSLIELIKYFEGFTPVAIKDYGHYTIGYGTAVDPREYPNGITEEEAEVLLREYVAEFEQDINSFALKNRLTFTQQQFDALVSFTYNLGPNWLNGDSTLRTAVLKGSKGNDFLFAITMWCMAGTDGEKQILNNLVRRRLIEANVYLNGVYNSAVPSNFSYVIFDNNMTDAVNDIRIQGYDTKLTDDFRANPTKSGYRFLGWYTAAVGGEWISKLDAYSAGKTLYGHWQKGAGSGEGVSANYQRVTTARVSVFDTKTGEVIKQIPKGTTITVSADFIDANGVKYGKAEGGWVDLRQTSPVKKAVPTPGPSDGVDFGDGSTSSDNDFVDEGTETSVVVTVTGDAVNIRKGPGTNYDKVGQAYKGDVLHITKIYQGTNYLWGRFAGGWICLDYTTYEEVVNGTQEEDKKEESNPSGSVKGVVVKTDKLNVRNKPGTSGTEIIGSYFRGDVVTITEQTKVGSTTWGKTDKGWISLYYVELLPADSGSENQKPEEKPEDPKPEDQKPEDSGSASKPAEKVIATGVVVDCTRLRIRKGPGTSYAEVGALAAGTPVEIYEKVAHGSQIWGRIDRGWICLDYVELDVEVSDAEGAITGTVYNCDRVNVRKGPGTNYEKVGKLNAGTKVQIFETTTVKGVKWGRISLGWVSMDYIKLDGTESTKPEPEKPGTQEPETKPTEPEKPGSGSVSGGTAKTGVIVNTTELRIRAGAGTKYDEVGKLKKGDQVVILETAKVGSATWGRIEKGWIHMHYVKLDGGEVPGGTISRTVTTDGLKIRAGAGTNYDKIGTYNKGDVVLIYEQTTVKGRPWGRTDRGWICLEYVK